MGSEVFLDGEGFGDVDKALGDVRSEWTDGYGRRSGTDCFVGQFGE